MAGSASRRCTVTSVIPQRPHSPPARQPAAIPDQIALVPTPGPSQAVHGKCCSWMAIGRCRSPGGGPNPSLQLLPFSVRGLVHPNICPALVWRRCTSPQYRIPERALASLNLAGLKRERMEVSLPRLTLGCFSFPVLHNTGANTAARTPAQPPGAWQPRRCRGEVEFHSRSTRKLPGWYVQYVPREVDLVPHRARPWPCVNGARQGLTCRRAHQTRIPAIQLRAEPGTTIRHRPISVSRGGCLFFFLGTSQMHPSTGVSLHFNARPWLGHNATAQKLCCVRRQCTIRSLPLCRTGPYTVQNTLHPTT